MNTAPAISTSPALSSVNNATALPPSSALSCHKYQALFFTVIWATLYWLKTKELEKQIIKSCHAHEIQDCSSYIDIIKYYYSRYEKTFGRGHPRLSAKAMDSVIDSFLSCPDNLDGLEYDPDAYYAMTDRHFQTQYENGDYNICHFMSEDVRNNRFYETGY